MSQENVATVYRLYAASRRRDKEACVREADPYVEIVSYLMGVEGTVYRGHAGVRRYIDDLFSAFPDWHPQILWTTEHGDRVLRRDQDGGTRREFRPPNPTDRLAGHHLPGRQDGRV